TFSIKKSVGISRRAIAKAATSLVSVVFGSFTRTCPVSRAARSADENPRCLLRNVYGSGGSDCPPMAMAKIQTVAIQTTSLRYRIFVYPSVCRRCVSTFCAVPCLLVHGYCDDEHRFAAVL